MLIDRHENTGTEPPTFYVNHAGHMVMRYTVAYDSGLRKTYEMIIEGRPVLVHEERPAPKELPVIHGWTLNMPERES